MKHSSKRKLITNSAHYSAGLLVENLCSLLSGFFVAKFLGPHIQGIWQTARLFRSYSEFTTLGQALGMRRQVAVAIGEGNEDEVERQRATGFTWNTCSLLLVGGVLAIYASTSSIDPTLRTALFTMALAVALTGGTTFFNLWYKTTERFGVLTLASIATGCAHLGVVLLLFCFGFKGLMIGYVLISITQLTVLAASYRERIDIRFYTDAFKSSLHVGFPLFLVAVTSMIFVSVDRILVIARMGFSDMGFYSVASMCFLPVYTVVSSISVVMLPKVCQRYGEDGTTRGLRTYYHAPLSVLMITLPVVACVGALCMPVIIRTFLPSYGVGIAPAQTMLIGLSFASASGFFHNIILAAHKQWWIVVATVMSCILKLVLTWVLIDLGYGLVGVAAAASVAYIIEFNFLFFVTSKITENSHAKKSTILCEAMLSVVCGLAVWLYIGGDITIFYTLDLSLSLLAKAAALLFFVSVAFFTSWHRFKSLLQRS